MQAIKLPYWNFNGLTVSSMLQLYGIPRLLHSYDPSSILRKQVARLTLRIGHYPRGLVTYASGQATLLEL